jgi:hypothetical protein
VNPFFENPLHMRGGYVPNSAKLLQLRKYRVTASDIKHLSDSYRPDVALFIWLIGLLMAWTGESLSSRHQDVVLAAKQPFGPSPISFEPVHC